MGCVKIVLVTRSRVVTISLTEWPKWKEKVELERFYKKQNKKDCISLYSLTEENLRLAL